MKHEIALYTEGMESVCGDILPFTPLFIYILLYTFSYISYTDIHIFTLCLFLYSLFACLCAFYDLIRALIVYVHFRAIIFQYSNVYSVAYWRRVITLKVDEQPGPGERVSGECRGNRTTD